MREIVDRGPADGIGGTLGKGRNADGRRRQVGGHFQEARGVLRQGEHEGVLREGKGAQQRLQVIAVRDFDHVGDCRGEAECAHAVRRRQDAEAVGLVAPEAVVLPECGELGLQCGPAPLVEADGVQLCQCGLDEVGKGDAACLHVLCLGRGGEVDRHAGIGAGTMQRLDLRQGGDVDMKHAGTSA